MKGRRNVTLIFDKSVHIVMADRRVGILVMSDVIDLAIGEEFGSEHPGRFWHHLINPSAVSCSFTSILDSAMACDRIHIEITNRSAWVITVRDLCVLTSSSLHTPTRRYTDGKDSFACLSCNAWLSRQRNDQRRDDVRNLVVFLTLSGRDRRRLR